MKQIIDLNNWERRDNFNFFRDFLNPCVSITSEVECAGARQRAKENGQSFFLHYFYAILRAANQLKELRYRFDEEGRVVLYDIVNGTAPIKVANTDRFYTVNIPWNEDFQTFHDTAREIIRNIPADANPYEKELELSGEREFDTILVSALPDLYFTSIGCTQEHKNGSDFPLMNVGKTVMREGKLVMPVSITVHHGFVDGMHLTRFFHLIEEFLK